MKEICELVRIKSLSGLKKWNKSPTEEKPIVMDWFYDWFFEKVLMKDNFEKAKDAFYTMVEFTEKCEKMSHKDSLDRVKSNLVYYSGYGWSTWRPKYIEFLKFIGE